MWGVIAQDIGFSQHVKRVSEHHTTTVDYLGGVSKIDEELLWRMGTDM
jgi:hypothetical protein